MQRSVHIEGIDAPIIIARRRGTRSIRLSVKSDGSIRLAIPYGVSEAYAIQFLQQKKEWLEKHIRPRLVLTSGMRIGKSHVLVIEDDPALEKPRTRLVQNQAVIRKPAHLRHEDVTVQKAAQKIAERVLSKEAAALLPQRLQTLAAQHGITFKSVTTKKLRSRWGSCDQHSNIVLNIYLMQLDWRLIDYVLIHELAHIRHPHHQASFWVEVERMLPDWKERRTEIKLQRTTVLPTNL